MTYPYQGVYYNRSFVQWSVTAEGAGFPLRSTAFVREPKPIAWGDTILVELGKWVEKWSRGGESPLRSTDHWTNDLLYTRRLYGDQGWLAHNLVSSQVCCNLDITRHWQIEELECYT